MCQLILSARTSTGCVPIVSADPNLKGKDSGESAAVAFNKFVESGGCVDNFIRDQCVILMPLARGTSSAIRCNEITERTDSSMRLAEKLTDAKFRILGKVGWSACVIECDGVGLITNPKKINGINNY